MYGANAFTGVINIITKEPDDFLKKNHTSGV
jgi:outer membrane receptor protein involved in Fe transport